MATPHPLRIPDMFYSLLIITTVISKHILNNNVSTHQTRSSWFSVPRSVAANLDPLQPIAVAVPTIFDCSNTGITGSNLARSVNVMLFCVGRDVAEVLPPRKVIVFVVPINVWLYDTARSVLITKLHILRVECPRVREFVEHSPQNRAIALDVVVLSLVGRWVTHRKSSTETCS